MIEELRRYLFPPWRWPAWYRQRRMIEERLTNLRVLKRMIDEGSQDDSR